MTINDKLAQATIEKLVSSYYFKFNIKEPKEDIYNSVVLSLIENSYLEKYDNTKSLHNYLSGFIYNYFCKIYRRESYVVNQAIGLESSLTPDGDFAILDTIDSASDVDPDLVFAVKQIEDSLSKIRYSSIKYIEYDENLRVKGIFSTSTNEFPPICIKRTYKDVFYMLKLGFTQIEIKQLLHSSKVFISKAVHYITSFQSLRNIAIDLGYLK